MFGTTESQHLDQQVLVVEIIWFSDSIYFVFLL